MRKILLLLLVILSFQAFGQTPPGYQTRIVRERIQGSFMVDSSLHIPRYCGTPSGVRGGGSVQDGALAVDTCNNLLYFYSGGAWISLSSLSTNIYNSNGILSDNRTLTGLNDTYFLAFDSVYFTQNAHAGSSTSVITGSGSSASLEASNAGLVRGTRITAGVTNIELDPRTSGTAGFIQLHNVPYNSSSDLIGLFIDTLTDNVYRKTAGGGFFNPNQTSTGNTAHDANYKSFAVTKLLSVHWKAGTGVNYMDEAYDSTYHAMVINKGSDFYGWEANATTGNRFMKIYANTSYVQAEPDSVTFNQSSGVYSFNSVPSDNSVAYVYGQDGAGHLVKRAASSIGSVLTFAGSVVKSNDSVFLKNEKIEPATDPSAYGYADGTYGYKPVIKLNESNLGQDYLIKYDTAASEYQTFNPNILMGKMEFVARRSGWISAGDSVLIDSNFINRKVWGVQIDGDWLSEISGHDYYEYNRATGELIIHPSPSDSSRVTVYTSWEPIWSTLTRNSAPVPLVWTDFDYDPAHDLEELTSGEWTIKGAASLPYTAVSNGPLSIPSSQDGAQRIRFYSAGSGGYNSIIGFDATTTNNSYGNYDYWAQCSNDGTIYVNENTAFSVNTGIQCADGDYLSIWRVGSTVTCKKSSDGINWTLAYTFSATTTGTLYAKVDCSFLSGGKLYNPEGYNLH